MQTAINTITRPLYEMSAAEVLTTALENGGRIGGMGFTVLREDVVASLCDAAQHGEQAARNLAVIGIDIASVETAPAPFTVEDETPFLITPVKHPYNGVPVLMVEGMDVDGADPLTEWYFTTRANGTNGRTARRLFAKQR